MNLLSVAWQFACMWAVIYAVVFLLKFYTSRKDTHRRKSTVNSAISLLPTSTIEHQHDHPRREAAPLAKDQWSIKLFQIKYTSQRWNPFFSRLAQAAPRFWHIWFSIGAFVSILIMIVGTLVIGYAAIKILISLGHAVSSDTQPRPLSKRSLTEEDDQVFLPMIPGITLPMSHLGYYLLALLFCGIFHEAGHAVAAFGERVPIQSAGIFIYYIYPGAFVNVPDQPLQMLSPFRQLKIICAGVWHNIVLYGCTLLLLAGGLKSLFLLFGWQSLEAGLGGVSVVSVRSNSPLAPHLATSSVIYQLNDFSLEQNIADWNAYLLEPSGRQPIVQGFCADSVMDSSDSSLDCCKISDGFPFGQSSNASVSCFQDIHSSTVYKKPEYMGCLPTIQVLASPGVRRCESDTDCQNESGKRCVTPYTPSVKGQLVRVYARLPEWEKTEADQQDKVFVFEGELVDIWESVKVGILVPRFWFLPVSLPHISELLIRYISSFTLALALMNILPAFKLDGEFALDKILAWLLRSNRGGLSTRTAETQRHIRHVLSVVVKMTSVVVGFVIIGSIILGIITSQSQNVDY